MLQQIPPYDERRFRVLSDAWRSREMKESIDRYLGLREVDRKAQSRSTCAVASERINLEDATQSSSRRARIEFFLGIPRPQPLLTPTVTSSVIGQCSIAHEESLPRVSASQARAIESLQRGGMFVSSGRVAQGRREVINAQDSRSARTIMPSYYSGL